MKRTAAAAVVALATVTGAVAFSTPAQAYTYTQCYRSGIGYGWNCYVNYDWWEEVFGGQHDGWVFVPSPSYLG